MSAALMPAPLMPAPLMSAALLLLADGRLPAGGHAHSGGVETSAERGYIDDVESLGEFLLGRLHTAGAVAASLAAAACRDAKDAAMLEVLHAEADARMPSPASRAASRSQGRALLRLAMAAWPSASYAALERAPHHAVVLGVVAAAAGLGPEAAALTAATASVGGPASAAVRLLGLDPMSVAALQARLSPDIDAVAKLAAADPGRCSTAPLLDLLAEEHVAVGVTLFAS